MPDEPDNLVLELLRAIRATLDQHTATLTQHTATLARLERRIGTMGGDVASIRQDAARDSMNRSHAEERVDALEDRLARVEAQLRITD